MISVILKVLDIFLSILISNFQLEYSKLAADLPVSNIFKSVWFCLDLKSWTPVFHHFYSQRYTNQCFFSKLHSFTQFFRPIIQCHVSKMLTSLAFFFYCKLSALLMVYNLEVSRQHLGFTVCIIQPVFMYLVLLTFV